MNHNTDKRILVPVDFSTHTGNSCDYALELACVTNCNVTLFHSFFEQVYFSDGGFSTGFESGILMTDELIHDFYRKKEESIKSLASEYTSKMSEKGYPALSFSYMIESGDPQVNILQHSKSPGTQMIIMGSSGMGKKAHLAGSVCERVINHSSVPVIAVPESASFQGISRVLYMTEFKEGDINALRGMRELFAAVQMRIYCLHLDLRNDDRNHDDHLLALSEAAHDILPAGDISFHVIDCQDPLDTINGFIIQNGISLIAYIPHRRGFFRSLIRQELTKKDLFLTNLPILAMPC